MLWPRVVIVSYFMLRMLADSMGEREWQAVSLTVIRHTASFSRVVLRGLDRWSWTCHVPRVVEHFVGYLRVLKCSGPAVGSVKWDDHAKRLSADGKLLASCLHMLCQIEANEPAHPGLCVIGASGVVLCRPQVCTNNSW